MEYPPPVDIISHEHIGCLVQIQYTELNVKGEPLPVQTVVGTVQNYVMFRNGFNIAFKEGYKVPSIKVFSWTPFRITILEGKKNEHQCNQDCWISCIGPKQFGPPQVRS